MSLFVDTMIDQFIQCAGSRLTPTDVQFLRQLGKDLAQKSFAYGVRKAQDGEIPARIINLLDHRYPAHKGPGIA